MAARARGKSGRVDDLGRVAINSSADLKTYLEKVRGLERDFFMELSFGAEEIQRILAGVPARDEKGRTGVFSRTRSRVQARRVARHLKRAAEANKYAGAQAMAAWREFVRSYAPSANRIGDRPPNQRGARGTTRGKGFVK